MKIPLTEALRKLQFAITYAEDGGLIDAAARAREAIDLLHQEHKRRAAILRSLAATPPAKKRAATKGRKR
jgi:hypothetical protein